MKFFGPESSTKRIFAVAGFALLASSSSLAQTQWQSDFPSALKLAARTNKPIFVDFFAEWCGPCKMLEKNVFSDSRVKILLQKTICLRLDIDQHQQEATRFSVTSIPRLMLFSPDGRKVLWDTMGYREADEFAQEFSDALHMKMPKATAPPAEAEPAPIQKVRAAIGSPGGLNRLASTEPALEKAGLRMLVAKLGVYKEADFQPPAALLESAGQEALPYLVEGMESKTLAVRVGSFKVVSAILSRSSSHHLAFDPWAPKPVRAAQLASWKHTLGSS